MKLPNLTREQFTDLKELLTERIVDNMTTEQLAEYVADDYFKYFDSLTYAEFMGEASDLYKRQYDYWATRWVCRRRLL